MRRSSRGGAGKEKMIMALSSVFVLAALTVTGLYIREKGEDRNDGYVVDFSAIEKEGTELAQNEGGTINEIAGSQKVDEFAQTQEGAVTADDLDYDPYYQETNSANVENEVSGKTDEKQSENTDGKDKDKEKNENGAEGMIDESMETANTLEEVAQMEEMEDTLALATSTSIQPALTFGDEDTLAWPIVEMC